MSDCHCHYCHYCYYDLQAAYDNLCGLPLPPEREDPKPATSPEAGDWN